MSVPADGEIEFNAYITSRPGEVQTQASTGAGYNTGFWFINAGNFNTAWAEGEVLRVVATNIPTGKTGTVDLTLTAMDPDMADDLEIPLKVYTPTFSPAPGTYTTAQDVTISCTTAGATIYYTTDGSDPDNTDTQYTAPINVPLNTTMTIKAIAYKTSWETSVIATGAYVVTGTVATPTFSPVAGTYATEQNVTISCTTAGATIYYTTDGSDPDNTDTQYTSPINIPLSTTMTIKAIAYKTDWETSGIATGAYEVTGTVATPTLSPAPGTYTTSQNVTLSCATVGATIYYTTDGSDPDNTDTQYTTPISVTENTTIKARAYKASWTESSIASASYSFKVATPTFSPAQGIYQTSQNVTISCATAGTTIYYTTDGSDPDNTDTQYTAPINVPLNTIMTIKAIAYKTNWDASDIATGAYEVTGKVATPTFSPAAGTYATEQNVTISCTTAGATIYYTTDGSDPDNTDTQYTSPINIPLSTTMTIKAIAYKTNWTTSDIATGAYEVTGTVATPTFSPAPGTYNTAQDVTISCATAGATIYYTTDGSDPDNTDTQYTTPISVSVNTTIKARAYKASWTESSIASGGYTFKVATPAFSPAQGIYQTSQNVTISCATAGVTIYYTTDGSDPDNTDTQYTAPINVPLDTTRTIKAIAYKTNWTTSDIATGAYEVTGTVATPTFGTAPGLYTEAQNVTLSCATAGATIYYTTDGTDPDNTSTAYTTAINIPSSTTMTLKAIAYKTNWTTSVIATGDYEVTGTVATPTFSPSAGTYSSEQTVTISCATAGATIYYTTDGSDPDNTDTEYTTPISVTVTSTTIKAKAYKTNWIASDIASANYDLQVATPTLSPGAGTYSSEQNVTISCATAGATIYYTTDGSDPDNTDTEYTAQISVTVTATVIKAKAYKTDWIASDIASGNYTLKVATPTLSPTPGTYTTAQDVTLSCATAGATIYYTTDGSSPDNTDTEYTDPINVPLPSTMTIRAKAYLTNWDTSDVAYGVYEVIPLVVLTMAVNPEGAGTTDPRVGEHEYEKNTGLIINAFPAQGYEFVSWTGSVEDKNSAYTTLNMDVSKTITANFERSEATQYKLTMIVTPEEGGTVSPPAGETFFVENTEVTVTAEPDSGYKFVRWEGDVENPDSLSTTIVMNSNKVVTVIFEAIPKYTLTMEVNPEGGGTVSPPVGETIFVENTEVTVTAEPDSGYKFVNWEGDVADPDSISTTVLMNSDKTVIANFEASTQFILSMSVNQTDWGVVTDPGVGEFLYDDGTQVTLTAEPNSGYAFSGWGGDVTGLSNPITIEMHTDMNVMAYFHQPGNIVEAPPTTVSKSGGSIDVNSTPILEEMGLTKLVVNLPPNAISGPVSIQIKIPQVIPEQATALQQVEFNFVGYDEEFITPVTISIPYSDATVSDETMVTVRVWDEENEAWIPIELALSIDVDGDANVVTFQVNHFSIYGIIDLNNPPTAVDEELISKFKVSLPYPNPFNPFTKIQYELYEYFHVELAIYDILGRKIAILQDGMMNVGIHEAIWDGKDLNGVTVGNGVYIYIFNANNYTKQGKIMFIK
ncbi:chitobiase/beta-hexosaminidase C-terminal domain-containing protein [Candidatus Latescibacterota bacterium]